MAGKRPAYVSEEDVEAALAESGYVSLPIEDTAALAEAFNRLSDRLFGHVDD